MMLQEQALSLSDNARTVLAARYLTRDENGNLVETPEELVDRVATAIALPEKTFKPGQEGEDNFEKYKAIFAELIAKGDFWPNSPTLSGAGRPLGQLSACFVLPVSDSITGIFETVKQTAVIHQTGGGTGFDFSDLRPEGAMVRSTSGIASGPVSFMKVFDAATEAIKQGGCFVGSQKVLTENGPVAISELRDGMGVYAYYDGFFGITPCTAPFKTIEDAEVWQLVLDDGQEIIGTADHPIWVRNSRVIEVASDDPDEPDSESIEYFIEKVKLSELKLGQTVLTFRTNGDYTPKTVVLVEAYGEADVYNVEVPGPHNYVVCDDAGRSGVVVSNTRRGANMGILRIDHPDIEKFIDMKADMTTLQNFNISVAVTDAFMLALENDSNYDLIDPRDGRFVKSLPARVIWDKILNNAWKNGDPGLIFIDRINESASNPVPALGPVRATNPCLRGDTLMLTEHGLMSIAALCGQHAIRFWTPTGWVSGQVWQTGHKNTVQIILSNGQRITTTPDHRFAVGDTWQEADSLADTRLEPFLGQGWPGGDRSFSDETLTLLGFLQGDGSFRHDGGCAVNLGKRDGDVAAFFDNYTAHGDRVRYIGKNDALLNEADRLGLSRAALPERALPKNLFTLSVKGVRAFLRGLYSANGCVIASAGRIALKTTCLELAEGLQALLLALGYRPYITTNKPNAIKWPNGTFTSRQSYDVNLVMRDAERFADEIGFLQAYKTEALSQIKKPESSRRLLPRVVAIEDAGADYVYDFALDSTHAGWANGFLVHNCGESPLYAYDSCNLGSINLAKFVVRLPNGGVYIDFERLEYVVTQAVRFLDNVIEANKYPLPEIDKISKAIRRIGLGVMGFADVLFYMGIPYNSQDAVKMAEALMSFISAKANAASEALAHERGAFPEWQHSIYGPDGENRLLRNANRTIIAPTGTISILADATGGIEPAFSLAFKRQHRLDKANPNAVTVMWDVNPAFRVIASELGVLDDDLISYLAVGGKLADHPVGQAYPELVKTFVTTHDIEPEWHVKIQAAFQRFTDNAVSKTINFANSASVQDVEEAYWLAWNLGCKGITIYRDGSREFQVLSHETKKLITETAEAPSVTPERKRLPENRQAITHKFQIADVEGYITVGLYSNGQPGELFLRVSKQGSMLDNLFDSLGIAISYGLQYGVPLKQYISKLKGLRFEPAGFTANRSIPKANSIIDYIFTWLDQTFYSHEYGDMTAILPLTHTMPVAEASGELCPECGVLLSHTSGCELCETCGYSKC